MSRTCSGRFEQILHKELFKTVSQHLRVLRWSNAVISVGHLILILDHFTTSVRLSFDYYT